MTTAKAKEPELKEYILKPNNKHHGFDKDGNRHVFVGGEKDNDRVMLTEAQYNAFKDKFVSVEDQKQATEARKEAENARADLAEARAKLAAAGIDLDDVLQGKEISIKKPDTGKATENEPTQTNNKPAPTGSTADPVNQPPQAKK